MNRFKDQYFYHVKLNFFDFHFVLFCIILFLYKIQTKISSLNNRLLRIMNNGGSGTHHNNNAGGGLNSNNSKQIGKSGLDFNFTQPIQLSTSMPHHNTGNNKSVGGFGVTQPGLQKILRSLGPKNQAANGAAVSQHLNANNNSGLTNHA